MKELKRKYDQLIAEAKKPSGVAEVMKVYEGFQDANAITEKYLQVVSPKSYQTTSSASLLR